MKGTGPAYYRSFFLLEIAITLAKIKIFQEEKKMKKMALSAIALCICLSAFAQKSDGEMISLKYVELPEMPFQPEISTYQTEVEMPYGLSSNEDREGIVKGLTSAMKIDGYDNVTEGGQIYVKALYHSFSTRNPEYLKREVEEKRDDKKVKVTYHYYRMDYKLPVSLQVFLNDDVLDDFFVSNSNDYTAYETPHFKTYSELSDFWSKNKSKVLADLKSSSYKSRLGSISSHLNKKYGYRKSSTSEKLFTFKTKKHNYEDYDKAMALTKEAFALYSDSLIYPVDSFKIKINEAIAIWNKAMEESDVSNKKARVNEKITGLTLKNLAFSYIWVLDFENAKKCIEAGQELDKGDGWVKSFGRELEEKKAKLERYEEVMNAGALN